MSAFVDGVGIASGAVVVLTGAAAVVGGTRARWRQTVGSRRALRKSLNKLAVGMPAENLEGMFGPCALRRDVGEEVGRPQDNYTKGTPGLLHQIYVTKHACVDAYVEQRLGTVVAFCITVSDRRFAPDVTRLTFGTLRDVRLGRTRFADQAIPQDGNAGVLWWNGAKCVGYAEAHYGANPGGYQTYVLARLQSGVGDLAYDEVPQTVRGGLATGIYVQPPGLPWVTDEASGNGKPGGLEPDYKPEPWAWFRAKTTVNTLQVVGPGWSGTLSHPGVHTDITRLLRDPPRTLTARLLDWRMSVLAQRRVNAATRRSPG